MKSSFKNNKKCPLQTLSVLFMLYFWASVFALCVSSSWWTPLLLSSLFQPTYQPIRIWQIQRLQIVEILENCTGAHLWWVKTPLSSNGNVYADWHNFKTEIILKEAAKICFFFNIHWKIKSHTPYQLAVVMCPGLWWPGSQPTGSQSEMWGTPGSTPWVCCRPTVGSRCALILC